MAAPLVLGTLDDVLDDLPGARTLLSASRRVELAWLPDAYVRDVVVRYEAPASLIAELALLLEHEGAQIARLGPIGVRLVPSLVSDRPLLLQLTLGGGTSPAVALALYDLRLGIDFEQPWLRRVDPATGRPIDEPLRIEVDAMVRVASDGTSDFRVYGLSVPPFAIARTGLVVALEDCQLAVDGAGVPLSLADFARGNLDTTAFDGVYARAARLSWIPQFRLPFVDHPGLTLHFEDVLIDGSGASFVLDERWDVMRAPTDTRRLSPRSALFGNLLGGRLRVAFERATGEVVQNVPTAIELDAWIECAPLLPLLKCVFSLERDPDTGTGEIGLAITQEPGTTLPVDLGIGSLVITDLAATGRLTDDALDVQGSARFAVNLPGWHSDAVTVAIALHIGAQDATLSVNLPSMGLGPLGELADVSFAMALAQDDRRDWHLSDFAVAATLRWHDLAARIGLANVSAQVPRPPDDAQVKATLHWQADGSLLLRLEAQAGDPTTLFGFLPPAFRPEVRDLSFGFEATFARAEDFFAMPSGTALAGTVFAGLRFRPSLGPAFAGNGVISLHAGDDEGFIAARLVATLDPAGNAQLALSLSSEVALDVRLPGASDDPFITVVLDRMSLELASAAAGAGDDRVAIELEGEFAVYPAALVPPALLAAPLAGLLEPLMHALLTGTISGTLGLEDDAAALDLECALDGAEIEVDVLALVAQLAQGRVDAQARRGSRQDLDVDVEVRFALLGFALHAGDLDDPDTVPIEVEVRCAGGVAGAELEGFVRFSNEAFVVGIDGASLPLALPPFPLRPEDVDALRDGSGVWTRARIDAALAGWRNAQSSLDTAHEVAQRKAWAVLAAKIGLTEFATDVWSKLSDDAARRTYQGHVTNLVGLVAAVQSVSHSASRPELAIDSAELRIPFADPRQIAVEGTARIDGFDDDDALVGLNGTELTLGLSADQVYFALKGSGKPIPLPKVADYSDGSITLSQLSFGYGFTRNSFAMAFAGELRLPPRLVSDADTSTRLGFGVRLPEYSRLAFRLDLIPVPGPIPVVPAFEFSLDLRSPGTPPLLDTQVCTPAWDGLQLRIPGVIRADLKAISASPLFGIIPAFNARLDGDIDLGNAQFGLTLVLDDLLWLLGIGTPPNTYTIPLLIDPQAPYFDHVCFNARFAGFGINFDVERPLPLPNPLIAFEVLGLIADPLHPIDPNGLLARCIRVTLRDAYVSIPAWAQPLIPGGKELVRHEVNLEINLGTVIGAAQWIVRIAADTYDRARAAIAAGQAALEDLAAHPPRFDAGDLLDLLPPELRVFDCELSFAGFEATATIILDATSAGAPSPPRPPIRPPVRPPVGPPVRPPTRVAPPILVLPDDWIPRFIGPGRDVVRPRAAAFDVSRYPALNGFTAQDLAAMSGIPGNVDTVLVVAQVRILDGASYRFLGWLASDGSFGLVTRVDVAPLSLDIAGIRLRLPLQLSARLQLSGRVSARERRAELVASGRGSWDVIPGVLRVVAGEREAVELRLDSRGRFRLRGEGAIVLLGPLGVRVSGTIDASEAHLAVSGNLGVRLGADPARPTVQLLAAVACRVEPGPHFAIAGSGTLRLFNAEVADVDVRVSENAIALAAAVDLRAWRIGPLQFDASLSASVEGEIGYRAGRTPELRLRGRGVLRFLGASLDGDVGLLLQGALVQITAGGALRWLGRDWLAARIAIDTAKGVNVGGRVAVAVDLTPGQLPGGIEVAHLFLRAEIDGTFTFGHDGLLARYDLAVDWTLGVRLDDAPDAQTFVLAMQKMRLQADGVPNVELFRATGFTFVPALDDIVIPVPKLTWHEEALESVRINITILDQVPFVMTHGFRTDLQHDLGNGIVKDIHTLFKVPKDLSLGTQNATLGELAMAMDFRVRLLWNGSDLGFEVRRGTDREFVGLRDMV